jgi:transposase
VKLAKMIAQQRPGIIGAIEHGFFNMRLEGLNSKVRLVSPVPSAFTPPHP